MLMVSGEVVLINCSDVKTIVPPPPINVTPGDPLLFEMPVPI